MLTVLWLCICMCGFVTNCLIPYEKMCKTSSDFALTVVDFDCRLESISVVVFNMVLMILILLESCFAHIMPLCFSFPIPAGFPAAPSIDCSLLPKANRSVGFIDTAHVQAIKISSFNGLRLFLTLSCGTLLQHQDLPPDS